MAEIQFRKAYQSGLAQFRSTRPPMVVTHGHSIALERRAFIMVRDIRQFDTALVSRNYRIKA